MRKMKKLLLILLVILTVLYVPTSAFATDSNDEKIMGEAMNYMKNNININQEYSTRAVEQIVKNYGTWRSESIKFTRTSGESGITAEVENWGKHYVDVCIFAQDSDQIIGSTKTVSPGQLATLSWTNSEMYDGGKTSKVYVFLTMYAEHYNPLTITVTHN